MRFRILLAAAALGLGSAAGAAAPTPAPAAGAPADSAVRREKAMTLARTVQPREIAVDMAIAMLDQQTVGGLLAVPDIKALEDEHPGVVAAMWQGARPLLFPSLEADLPGLWRALAGVYERLTPAELDGAIAFFGSPVGQKLLRSIASHSDVREVIASAAQAPDADISREAVNRINDRAANAAAGDLTRAEQQAVTAFTVSSVAAALQRLQPDIERVTSEWMNAPDPELDVRMEKAMKKAMQAFLASEAAARKKKG